ncbi:MAG: hypothetical protein IKU19_07805 [Clostridia bacterium]|nr:hypothetical protein [Clostridia bacterium]
MKEKFEEYLIKSGYKILTPSGKPSTVYDYIKRIDFVCETEGKSWNELYKEIKYILPQYESGGEKETIGSKSHNAVRCALRCFYDFSQNESAKKKEKNH